MASVHSEMESPSSNLTGSLSTISIPLENEAWVYFVSVIAASSLIAILWPLTKRSVKVPIPLAKLVTSKQKRNEAYSFDSRRILQQGYEQFKDKPFGVDSTEGVKVVVPMNFLDKLKSHAALSFQKSIDNDLLKEYSRVGGLHQAGVNIIHTKFNPTLPAFIPQLHAIVRDNLMPTFGSAKDWTSTHLHQGMTQIICKASAYVMHDEEASKNPEWLHIIEDYVIKAAEYAQALKVWPPFLRPIVCLFVPQRKELAHLWKEAEKILRVTLDSKKAGTRVTPEPPTILDYLTSGPNAEQIHDIDRQVQLQLILAVASIHTTSSSILHCLYDLAARPEYVSELRQEAKEVLDACGRGFTKEGLSKLEKLDSFMKESQRLCSPDLTTFQRMATEPLTLPDGTYVPEKTKIEMATCSINVDGTYFENPHEFDGLRFYRRRQNGESNLIYTSVGKTNLGWGVGRHACPGRFLADIEIKLIIAELLLHYDIKNPEGQPRHRNLEFEAIVFPDPEAKVMLKALDVE